MNNRGERKKNFNFYRNNIAGDVYIGNGSGKNITDLMEKAQKRIWILSPYIAGSNLDLLINIGKTKEIDIRIITNENQLQKLLKAKNIKLKKESTQFYNKPFYSYTVNNKNISFYYVKNYYEKDKKDKKELITFHSKIYLIDDTFFIGSVNFTFLGFHKNIETRFKCSDSAAKKGIENFFNSIFKDTEYITQSPKCRNYSGYTIETAKDNFLKEIKDMTMTDWEQKGDAFFNLLENSLDIDEQNPQTEVYINQGHEILVKNIQNMTREEWCKYAPKFSDIYNENTTEPSKPNKKPKKLLIAVFIVLSFILGIGLGLTKPWKVFYDNLFVMHQDYETAFITQDVNLRSDPNTESAIIMILKAGTQIKILDKTEFWYQIELDTGTEKVTGFIVSSYAE